MNRKPSLTPEAWRGFGFVVIIYLIIMFAFRLTCADDLDAMARAEAEYKAKQRQDSIAAYQRIHQAPDTTVKMSRRDTTTIHNIFVDDTPEMLEIQHIIDSAGTILYSDKWFKKAKKYSFEDKKRFVRWLAEKNLVDTVKILQLCTDWYSLQDFEYQKILLIIDSQDAATKAILQPHLKTAQDKMRDITRLIFTLSPKEK